eukprot:TRINITY_DN5407_c0_g1_i1.p1 TRINITY_DN5407_c0_g1~~TRINITY_DN5407_c0_g1_i1.p1  ORF type:complete len:1205 (-),score=266.29 TRINITY_DN5407_c0_g1_i1:52-3405(-)
MQEPVNEDLFLNVREVIITKPIPSLVHLWYHMMPDQLLHWSHNRNAKSMGTLQTQLAELVQQAQHFLWYGENKEAITQKVFEEDPLILYGIVRALHLQIRLEEIDQTVNDLLVPPVADNRTADKIKIGNAPLVLDTFLDYLTKHGVKEYSKWLNSCSLRLISTVHPNETERNSNLRHWASLSDKYLEWKKDFASIQTLPTTTRIYRARREETNQLRRAIKAEVEAIWQSDQMRTTPILVEAEAKRVMERSNIIMDSYPQWVKLVKSLNKEAFWRYEASLACKDKAWRSKYTELRNNMVDNSLRYKKLALIKATFKALNIKKKPPRIINPIIEFSTWKGGDRDGNPFVTASFSNEVFVDHKIFVLEKYQQMVSVLLDSLTPSSHHVACSPDLAGSLRDDKHLFPYIPSIKPTETYRNKLRLMSEKLENTIYMVKEVKKKAGATVKPLLGQSLPGPTGYGHAKEFESDLIFIYDSLVDHAGKSQARSLIQDLIILVSTFGFHLNSVDFRQVSTKNLSTLQDYFAVSGVKEMDQFSSKSDSEKRQILVNLLSRGELEFDPFLLSNLSSISADTFYSFIVFADAAKADSNAVGKFIISMCSGVNDILVILLLLRLVGMLVVENGKIVSCPFDVTGLFETIPDMKNAPTIITELLEIDIVRDYIVNQRGGYLTVMLGYSDSVRDGSSLASDSQINATSLLLKNLEKELNNKYQTTPPFELIFYRGRGDTIPRGFGGSIDAAVLAQVVTTPREDHTEQNRYLRRYFSISSATEHYHKIYSAHIGSQLQALPPNTDLYQRFFNFFGLISNLHYNSLVKTQDGGKGEVFFRILNTYSILPHLAKSHFASRPVARANKYDIDSIRAIPFVMVLAQIREFSSAFYGTGTAFQVGSDYLSDATSTAKKLLKIFSTEVSEFELQEFKDLKKNKNSVAAFCRLIEHLEIDVESTLASTEVDEYLRKILNLYPGGAKAGCNALSVLLLDLDERKTNVLSILREMFANYRPFSYSISNKESSLLIRNKQVTDLYLVDATEEEKAVIEDTEREANLTKEWILKIMGQDKLVNKNVKKSVFSPEMFLLHCIQSRFLKLYRDMKKEGASFQELNKVETYIQLTILAISEGLGFGG